MRREQKTHTDVTPPPSVEGPPGEGGAGRRKGGFAGAWHVYRPLQNDQSQLNENVIFFILFLFFFAKYTHFYDTYPSGTYKVWMRRTSLYSFAD